VQLLGLREQTPDFRGTELWSPNSPDLYKQSGLWNVESGDAYCEPIQPFHDLEELEQW